MKNLILITRVRLTEYSPDSYWFFVLICSQVLPALEEEVVEGCLLLSWALPQFLAAEEVVGYLIFW